MATRSHWRDDSTSFDIDVDADLDLDATTPVRSFDVRAAFDFDRTVANPDHPLVTAEREIWNRERSRISPPPPAPLPPPRYGNNPESIGSLAPTAMELPRSHFPSFTPSSGTKAPPLSIVSHRPQHAVPFVLAAEPAKPRMSAGMITMMCGALAVAAAVVAFTAAGGMDSGVSNASAPQPETNVAPQPETNAAPQPETTAIPARAQNQSARATALPADVAQLFVPPSAPNADWRARLMQNQGARTGATPQH